MKIYIAIIYIFIFFLNAGDSENIRYEDKNGSKDFTFYTLTQDNSFTHLIPVEIFIHNDETNLNNFSITFEGNNFLENGNRNKIETIYCFKKTNDSSCTDITLNTPIYLGTISSDRKLGELFVRTKINLQNRRYKAGIYKGILKVTYTSSSN